MELSREQQASELLAVQAQAQAQAQALVQEHQENLDRHHQQTRLQQEAAAQCIAELESNLQAAYQEEQELRDDIEEEEARVAAEQEQALIVALEAKLRTAQLKQRDEQVRFVTSLNA